MGQLRLDLWGFLGGWLRAGTLSGKSGGAPCQALRQAHFGLLPSPPLPSKQTTRGGLPLTSGPWAGAGGPGAGVGVLCSPEVGGLAARCGALASPHTVSSAPFPRAGHFLPQAAVGTVVPPSKVCAILSHPPPGEEGGADPRAGVGEGTAGQMGSWPQGAAWAGRSPLWESLLSESAKRSPLTRRSSSLPTAPFIGINLGTS